MLTLAVDWEDKMPTTSSNFHPVQMTFVVDLPKFPEWAIPFTKIIPKAYMDDGFDPEVIESDTLNTFCRHFWKNIGEDHWQIYVELLVIARLDGVYLPIYTDVDLVIMNERVWEEINSNKS
jgi:hypothetical protein